MITAMYGAMYEPTKNEHVATVKHLFDSSHLLKSAATTYTTLLRYRLMPNHDISMLTGLLTGAILKTPINSSD